MKKFVKVLLFLSLVLLCLVPSSWGIDVLSPQKITNLFLNPGESTVLEIKLRGKEGDGKIEASEAVFSLNKGKIAWFNNPLAKKFIDPNFLSGDFLLKDGEEISYNVPIFVDFNTKPGSYPRVLLLTPHGGDIVNSVKWVDRKVIFIYVNVVGSPVRDHVIEADFTFSSSSENKRGFISGKISNYGNFYYRVKDAFFSLETPNRVLERKLIDKMEGSNEEGEIYIFPGETQTFRSEISVSLLPREDYEVKISFFCKDLDSQNSKTDDLKFDEGRISKKFPLPISLKLSEATWGPLAYFSIDPSEEEEDVVVPKDGTAVKSWIFTNSSTEILKILISSSQASQARWEIKTEKENEFDLPPEGRYELSMGLSNPRGEIEQLEGVLTFTAIDTEKKQVGIPVVKRVIQRIMSKKEIGNE